jgi:hypothetical protein
MRSAQRSSKAGPSSPWEIRPPSIYCLARSWGSILRAAGGPWPSVKDGGIPTERDLLDPAQLLFTISSNPRALAVMVTICAWETLRR